jgi:hypothetical protein
MRSLIAGMRSLVCFLSLSIPWSYVWAYSTALSTQDVMFEIVFWLTPTTCKVSPTVLTDSIGSCPCKTSFLRNVHNCSIVVTPGERIGKTLFKVWFLISGKGIKACFAFTWYWSSCHTGSLLWVTTTISSSSIISIVIILAVSICWLCCRTKCSLSCYQCC